MVLARKQHLKHSTQQNNRTNSLSEEIEELLKMPVAFFV